MPTLSQFLQRHGDVKRESRYISTSSQFFRCHLDASWTGLGICLSPPNFLREHRHAKKVGMCLALSNYAFKKGIDMQSGD
jgi:hypothetical protein